MKYHNMKLINAEYLRKSIEDCKCLGKQIDIEDVLKMIDMTPAGFDWISVDDRLPETETRVLVCGERKIQHDNSIYKFVADAIFHDGDVANNDSQWGYFGVDELESLGAVEFESDGFWDYLIPKGWYEVLMSYNADYDIYKLDDKDTTITHWAELPEPPKEDE